jgi:hypothetical protein
MVRHLSLQSSIRSSSLDQAVAAMTAMDANI